MSVTVILDIQVKPDAIEGLKKYLPTILPDTRKYDGYEELLVKINQDNPLNIIMVERWKTCQHYEKYLN